MEGPTLGFREGVLSITDQGSPPRSRYLHTRATGTEAVKPLQGLLSISGHSNSPHQVQNAY